jgi:periplasmic protein TonB
MQLADIVFEKRNKEYGAYYLRKKAVRYLGVSFSITLLLCLLFIGYLWLRDYMDTSYMPSVKGVIFEPSYLSNEQVISPEPPKPEIQEAVVPQVKDDVSAPVVTDSVPNKTEKPQEEQKKDENEQGDSLSGPGSPGLANGDITVPVERMPEFPGGEKALNAFMQRNVRYAQLSKNNKVRGLVIISFVVKRDGTIGNIKIVKSLNTEFDQECIRVVNSMPRWMPAISGGRPIEIIHNLPFVFSF